MGYRDISPLGVSLVDSGLAECVQATWEKGYEDGLGHIEPEARHNCVFVEGPENVVRHICEVGDHQR
eukprot:3102894-Heterocapsa_arctica.AAC.1